MHARTTQGSTVTLTESGILLEHSGHFGINKNNKEIPFSAVRSINFEKHLVPKVLDYLNPRGTLLSRRRQ